MSRIQRNRSLNLDLPGVRATPNAPGVVPDPGISGTASLVQQSLQILRSVGGAAEQAGQLANQMTRDELRRQALLEQDRKDAEQFTRGTALRHANENLATLIPQIQSGEVKVPAGVSIDQYVHSMVANDTQGFDAAYVDEYAKHTTPRLLGAFTVQDINVRQAARDHGLDLLAERAMVAESPANLMMLKGAAARAYPDITDEEFLTKVVLPGADAASRRGDQKGLDAAISVMGDRFPDKRAQFQAQMAQSVQRQRMETLASFRDSIAGQYIDGVPHDEIAKSIQSWRDRVGADVVDNALQENAARAKQSIDAANKAQIAAFRGAVLSQVGAADDAAVAAGAGFLIDDYDYKASDGTNKLPDGSAIHLSRTDRIDQAFSRTFEALKAKFGDNTTGLQSAMIDVMTRNDYVYPAWSRTLAAGYTAASEANQVADPKLRTGQLPTTLAGLDLFAKMKASSPALLSKMVQGKAYDFYDMALTAMDDPAVGRDPARAVLVAQKAMTSGITPDLARKVVESSAKKIAEPWLGWNAKNTPEIQAEISRRAELKVRAGLPPDEAVDRARADVEQAGKIINGWWTPVDQMSLPSDLGDHLSRHIESVAEDFAAKHGKEAGIEAGDITIRMGKDNGFWYLTDARTGLPLRVDGDPSATVFTTQGLTTTLRRIADESVKARVVAAKKAREEARSLQARQAARFSNVEPRDFGHNQP